MGAGWALEAELERQVHEGVQEEMSEPVVGSAGFGGAGNVSMTSAGPRSGAAEAELHEENLVEVLGEIESGDVWVSSMSLQQSESETSNLSPMCHPHAPTVHCESSACGGLSVGFGGVSSAGGSVGFLGSPRWARGRWSARLWSPWCCPGCGLYGDGTLCMTCDTHGVMNSCMDNSSSNSRSVRGPEHREGTKPRKASSGIQVGFPVVDNVPGNASLVDYLRWAPKKWPVEGWECRTVLTPWVDKVNFSRRRV